MVIQVVLMKCQNFTHLFIFLFETCYVENSITKIIILMFVQVFFEVYFKALSFKIFFFQMISHKTLQATDCKILNVACCKKKCQC